MNILDYLRRDSNRVQYIQYAKAGSKLTYCLNIS